MTDFIKGKIKPNAPQEDLFTANVPGTHQVAPLTFSEGATAVFNAGRELWKYYHGQHFPSVGGVPEGRGGYNVNASLYDIREHFQGRNEAGKMNTKSPDETYMALIGNLREKLRQLASKIEPNVYKYGFLRA